MNKKIEIIYPLILYALTIYGLILILKNPAKGYELSVYTSSFKELSFLIASSLGAIIYIYFIDKERKFLITMVLILILINNFIILSLPILRGYIIQGDMDTLTHLGYMKDIIDDGSANYIIYPISHIFVVNISLLGNVSVIQTTAYISQFFLILYMVYITMVSKKIFNDQIQAIFILLSSTTFLFLGFEADFKPQFLSLISIPMFLYFLFSKPSFGTRVILILLVILVQFFHPLTSIYFVVGISLMILYMVIKREKQIVVSYNDFRELLSIGMISFIQWISNFHYYVWNSEIGRLYRRIKGSSTVSSPIGKADSQLAKLKLTRFDLIELIIRMFGHILIYLIISLIFIVCYFKFKEKGDSDSNKYNKYLINILIIFFISGIIMQLIIVGGGIDLRIIRGLNFMVILTPIFVGSLLYQFKKKYFTKRMAIKIIVSIFILSIISFSWLIGTFGVFPSSYVKMPNIQITKTNMFGADWFFNYKDPNITYIGGFVYVRFSHLLLGYNSTTIRKNDPGHWDNMLPDHFNYDRLNRLGENFTKDTYMTVAVYDKLLYTAGPWKPVARFTNGDFDNLSNDSSANNFYDNGAMNIYYIKHLENLQKIKNEKK